MINILTELNNIKEKILPKEKNNPWDDLYGNNVAPHLEYPEGSMYDAVAKTIKKYPINKAYTYYGRSTRYIKFYGEIVLCAKSLKKLGVEKGDKVTICMPNTPNAIVMFYAINMIGAISNMIHPLSSENEIEYYINKSKSKYLLCIDMCYPKIIKLLDNSNLEKVIVAKVSGKMPIFMQLLYPFTTKQTKVEYNDKVISWRKFIRLGRTYLKDCYEKMNSNDDAVILYSGGTTGDPKGVVLSNLNFNALATQCFKMTDPAKAGDSILGIMPIFHGFGLGVCVHTALTNGMSIIPVPLFKAKEFSKLIKKNHPTFLVGVPTMYEALVNSKEKNKKYLSGVTSVICGGDTLNETLRKQVNEYLKSHGSSATIRVGYGLTECTGASCLTPRYYFKEGGIGIPLPDMIYKIIKESSHKECDYGEIGEICISGPTVMKRYLDDSEETKKTLKRHMDGKLWLHTGDMGYMDNQGLIFFESRLKRIIVSSGYNIYPQYVEKVIDSHPAVLSCTVIGIPHQYKKQVPKAYIVLRENFDLTEDLKEDIKKYTAKSVAKYSLPYEYEYVDEIPKTKVGKVAFTKLEKKNINNKQEKHD